MRLRTRTYSENITAGNKRRATNRSFTDPDPKRYLNHSLSIPRYPKTRVGFGMGFFRDPESRIPIPEIRDRDFLFWARSKNPDYPEISEIGIGI